MSKSQKALSAYIEKISAEAQALLSATSGVASERVAVARERLDRALDSGREFMDQFQKRASSSARTADTAVRENPYVPILAALVLGAIIAFLFSALRRD
ncbi:MAG: hypothetical protein ACK5LK_00720 [Chthoniobacterales bacterium]